LRKPSYLLGLNVHPNQEGDRGSANFGERGIQERRDDCGNGIKPAIVGEPARDFA